MWTASTVTFKGTGNHTDPDISDRGKFACFLKPTLPSATVITAIMSIDVNRWQVDAKVKALFKKAELPRALFDKFDVINRSFHESSRGKYVFCKE